MTKRTENLDRILRPKDVADVLGVHTATIWRWRQRRAFPEPLRMGTRLRGWRQSTIDAWLDEQHR